MSRKAMNPGYTTGTVSNIVNRAPQVRDQSNLVQQVSLLNIVGKVRTLVPDDKQDLIPLPVKLNFKFLPQGMHAPQQFVDSVGHGLNQQ